MSFMHAVGRRNDALRNLRWAQDRLAFARAHYGPGVTPIRLWEARVLRALYDLWEAQQALDEA